MNSEQMKYLIENGKLDQLESAWMQAIEENCPLAEMASVLELLVVKLQLNMAEVLGWTLVAQRLEALPPPEALAVAKAVVLAVPDSDELRTEAANLYRKVFAGHPHLEALLTASGLLGGQSARRAFRTLDVGLNALKDAYLANRFEPGVLRMVGFDPALGQFELLDARGSAVRFDPKALADDYDIVDANDFRVLTQHRLGDMAKLLDEDPAAVLIGACISHEGQIDALELKELLTPKYMPEDKWSGWWNRARTAAKRCPQLTLEGRPVTVKYYAQGRTLEEEMASLVQAARMPLEYLGVLQQYVRELKARKVAAHPGFAQAIVDKLAEQARHFRQERPADALAAALAVGAAAQLGMPAPSVACAAPAEILQSTPRPADAVAALELASLWPAALDALAGRPDAVEQLGALLYKAPAGQLDLVADRLAKAGQDSAVAAAVPKAMADPVTHLPLFLWLWKGPAKPPANTPTKVELLSRVLQAMQELDHDIEADANVRKQFRTEIRSAMSATDYASFKQAIAQMDTAVAGTIKRRVEHCIGLAEAVRDDMIQLLRENFYSLFATTRVEAWLDETVIYTSPEGLRKREALRKELIEVKIPENARAIGAAAAHGDLSENSEWKFAVEERDLLAARLKKVMDEIDRSRLIRPEDVPTDSVGIGSKVLLRRATDGKELELTFMGLWDGDLEKNIFSYQTGLGQEMMGKAVGDVVNIKLEGSEGEYRIEGLFVGVKPPEALGPKA
jgi:transcription elongation GreA/GreB family factor